jgi:hypothetical protein
MERLKGLSFFLGCALVCAAFYAILRMVVSPNELIILLNGLFFGAVTAVAIAYGKLVLFAILGRSPYDKVWQMTLGFFILWLAVFVAVANSVFIRTIGEPAPINDLTSIARYLSIIAACVQVTAPDFGLGIFHGRDRKVLWASVTVGLLVAVLVILLQQFGQEAARCLGSC